MKKITKRTITILVVSIISLSLATTAVFAATNISEIEDLYLAFKTAQVEQAVDNGDMTDENAQEILANMSDRMAEDEKDAVPPINGRGGMRGNENALRLSDPIATYAELTDQELSDVLDALKDGETDLATLADEAGVLDELKVELKTQMTAGIEECLADGRIDEDRATQMKADMDEKIDDMLSGEHRGPRGGRGQGQGKPGGRGQNRETRVEDVV